MMRSAGRTRTTTSGCCWSGDEVTGQLPGHRHPLRPFTAEELDAAMKACGLTPRERFGRFDGKPFDPEDTRHIGVVEG